jgi:hypothetical protein
MEPIQFIFWSPIAVTLFAVGVFAWTRLTKRSATTIAFSLFVKTVLGWAFGLGAAAFTASLIYSKIVGASTGPLGAIFFFGPLGFTLGVIVGLGLWCFRRRKA